MPLLGGVFLKMANVRAPKIPFAHLGVVLGATALLVFGFRHFANAEPAMEIVPGEGAGFGGPVPLRPVTKFALTDASSGVMPDPATDVNLPFAKYLVEIPNGVRADQVKAFLKGSDGTQLDLTPWPLTASLYAFQKFGYEKAPTEARLVVREGDKVVLDRPVPPLMPPIRAIPLVVPIDPHLRLQKAKPTTSRWDTNPTRGRPYTLTGVADPTEMGSLPQVLRTEWSAGRLFVRGRFGGDSFTIYAEPGTETGGFVEIDTPYIRRETLTRDVDLAIDVYHDGKETKVRIPQTVTIEYPDGALMEIPAQQRRLPVNRKGEIRAYLSFTVRERIGRAALFTAFGKTNMPTPTGREGGSGGTTGGGGFPPGVVGFQTRFLAENSFEFETVGPSLADAGFQKISFGSYALDAYGKAKPLELGTHRLKLRITHNAGSVMGRRRFVAVSP